MTDNPLRNLSLKLEKFGTILTKRSRRVVEDITKKIFDESQRIVPVDTGALKGSGKMEVTAEKSIGSVYTGNISYGGKTSTGPTKNAPDGVVFYAVTVHETNKPFLLQAFYNVKSEANRNVKRHIRNMVREIFRNNKRKQV